MWRQKQGQYVENLALKPYDAEPPPGNYETIERMGGKTQIP